MKNKILLIFLFCSLTSSCQLEKKDDCFGKRIIKEYNYKELKKEWVKKDTTFVKKLIKTIKETQHFLITDFIKPSTSSKKIKLGNNAYSFQTGAYGRGYISVFYEFLLKEEKIISYKLILKPEDFLLLKKLNIDVEVFLKNELGNYVYSYNLNLRNNINFYMSPFSGINYGCRGGYGNITLKNRCFFKKIENSLSNSDVIHILSSVNPASRLTAIEYYYKNKDKFNKLEEIKINKLIKKEFAGVNDKYPSFNHDIYYFDSPKKLVQKQLDDICK